MPRFVVLTGSPIAALLAGVVLQLRNWVYRGIHAAENADTDHDGIFDVYDTGPAAALTAAVPPRRDRRRDKSRE